MALTEEEKAALLKAVTGGDAAPRNTVREFVGSDGWIYYQPVGPDGRPSGSAYTLGEPAPTKAAASTGMTEAQRADLELQRAGLDQRIKEADALDAREGTNQRYLQEKLAMERKLGESSDARASQSMLEQITARRESTALTRAGMIQQQQSLQAQLDAAAQAENARLQVEAARINEERRQFNLAQRGQNAEQLAGYTRNPSDAAAVSAYTLASSGAPLGMGNISTAIGSGQDWRTDQALAPGGELLSIRDELAKGPQVFTPPTISAPRLAPLDFSSLNGLQANGLPAGFVHNGYPGGWNPSAQAAAPAAPAQGQYGTWNTGNANTGYVGSVDAGGNLVATPAVMAADGFEGIVTTPTTFVAGEAGPEHVSVTPGVPTPASPSNSAVTPMTSAPADIAGTFSQQADLVNRAREFLNSAGNGALGRSAWARLGVPTPVGVSAPGTSQYVQQVAAAIAAALKGVPPELFMEESKNLAPVGLSGNTVTRRSGGRR